MRILYVVDGRSPIALNWINYFVETGHQVHLVSTFRCQPEQPFASLNVIPVAFSSAKPGGTTKSASKKKGGIWGASTVRLRTSIRHWLGPVTLPRAARRLREVIARIEPDLIHAMRIPYEGMLSALAEPNTPLLISVWGNDFTLHAPATPWMRHYTRLALKHANALHADCQRDIRLAQTWGFPADRPTTVLPGAGGLQPEIFYPPATAAETREGTREANATVINPRGIRAYVRNDTFFRSIPLVLAKRPEVRFLCPTMANELSAQRWLDELSIREYVELLPHQTRPQMADLFRRSRVAVSPSIHDGTPNTLLEAMACGCVPVAGDIESLHEWITPGINGLLVDPSDPQALAEAILVALENQELYQRALTHNTQLIAERASHPRVMAQALSFYQSLTR